MGWRVASSERALHHGNEKSERISSVMAVMEATTSLLWSRWGGGSQLVVV